MVSWSSFLRPAGAFVKQQNILQSQVVKNAIRLHLRKMSDHGHHKMHVTPSRFQWNKFKDQVHFYAMLGLIPCTAIVLYCNIFIGPATLSEIPEGYEPKHWEYHRHPITRFLARYLYASPQQDYEKALHYLYEENEKALMRKLETEIQEKMAERGDYQGYYYRPGIAKYHRISKEAADHLASIRGE